MFLCNFFSSLEINIFPATPWKWWLCFCVQVKPVNFTVQAIVTSSDLQFDQPEVDFGYCSVYQSVRSSVLLTNLSLLPQDFGFVSVPEVQYENLERVNLSPVRPCSVVKVRTVCWPAALQEGRHVGNTAMCTLQVPCAALCGCVAFISPAGLGRINNKNIENSLLLIKIKKNWKLQQFWSHSVFIKTFLFWRKAHLKCHLFCH